MPLRRSLRRLTRRSSLQRSLWRFFLQHLSFRHSSSWHFSRRSSHARQGVQLLLIMALLVALVLVALCLPVLASIVLVLTVLLVALLGVLILVALILVTLLPLSSLRCSGSGGPFLYPCVRCTGNRISALPIPVVTLSHRLVIDVNLVHQRGRRRATTGRPWTRHQGPRRRWAAAL